MSSKSHSGARTAMVWPAHHHHHKQHQQRQQQRGCDFAAQQSSRNKHTHALVQRAASDPWGCWPAPSTRHATACCAVRRSRAAPQTAPPAGDCTTSDSTATLSERSLASRSHRRDTNLDPATTAPGRFPQVCASLAVEVTNGFTSTARSRAAAPPHTRVQPHASRARPTRSTSRNTSRCRYPPSYLSAASKCPCPRRCRACSPPTSHNQCV
jgi:hypothetical protein